MKPRYYWVPENFLFENAGDCLDARPDDGAAALVVDHVSFDRLRDALEEIADQYVTEGDCPACDFGPVISDEHHETCAFRIARSALNPPEEKS